MWWRPARFSLKGKVGIRGQRRGAVLPHSALSTNRPADPCTTATPSSPAHLVVVVIARPVALTFRTHKGVAVNTVAVERAQEADQIFNEVVDIPCVMVE